MRRHRLPPPFAAFLVVTSIASAASAKLSAYNVTASFDTGPLIHLSPSAATFAVAVEGQGELDAEELKKVVKVARLQRIDDPARADVVVVVEATLTQDAMGYGTTSDGIAASNRVERPGTYATTTHGSACNVTSHFYATWRLVTRDGHPVSLGSWAFSERRKDDEAQSCDVIKQEHASDLLGDWADHMQESFESSSEGKERSITFRIITSDEDPRWNEAQARARRALEMHRDGAPREKETAEWTAAVSTWKTLLAYAKTSNERALRLNLAQASLFLGRRQELEEHLKELSRLPPNEDAVEMDKDDLRALSWSDPVALPKLRFKGPEEEAAAAAAAAASPKMVLFDAGRLLAGRLAFSYVMAFGGVVAIDVTPEYVLGNAIGSANDTDSNLGLGASATLRLHPGGESPDGFWVGPYAGATWVRAALGEDRATAVIPVVLGMAGYTFYGDGGLVFDLGGGAGWRFGSMKLGPNVIDESSFAGTVRLAVGYGF